MFGLGIVFPVPIIFHKQLNLLKNAVITIHSTFCWAQIHPDDVYQWFMGNYIDAYDRVMVPSVYGMSQFADGGSFATKPYISGANYIRKMSDYPRGDWVDIWTTLYWNFINEHTGVFRQNHRLSMMSRLLTRMKAETRERHFKTARAFLGDGQN